MSTPMDYFANPDEGIDESAPVENQEIDLFELADESGRTELANWAVAVLPGVDLGALQQRVRTGDLVLRRPGSNSFDVYSRSENVSFEDRQLRLQCLQLVSRENQTNEVLLRNAEEVYGWVTGAQQV